MDLVEWKLYSEEELKVKLDELEEDLDEVTLEKTMVLGQRGHHISHRKIMEQSKEFEEKIVRLNDSIASIQDELKRRAQ